jgi:hypothetical protein
MSDRKHGAQFWLDIEWVDPKPNADDDRSAVQGFINKLSQAIKALPHGADAHDCSLGTIRRVSNDPLFSPEYPTTHQVDAP